MGRNLKKVGLYVYIRLIHFAVWQKLTQHCKAAILQKKLILKREVRNNKDAYREAGVVCSSICD